MRKKISVGLLTGGIAVALASPAASATVDFHGTALMGLINTSNAKIINGGVGDPESSTIGVGKVRFRAEVASDDGLAKLVYGFETGGNNFGDSGSWNYSGDSEDFENRFAYVQSSLPGMNDNIYARAGLQLTGINHWLWTETAAGLTLHGEGQVNWLAGWFRGNEIDIADDNDDSDLFVARMDFEPSSNLKLGGFGVYALDFGGKSAAVQDADQYWVGVTGEIDGPVFASADFLYEGGDSYHDGDLDGDGDDISAYLANLTVGTKVSDSAKISLNMLYVSGDDDLTDGDHEEFEGIDADVKIGQIFFKDSLAASLDRFGADQPYKLANGLINVALQGEVQLDSKNKLRAAARYLASAEDITISGEDEDELGYEFDLWYSHEMNKNLTFKIEGAYLLIGDLAEFLLQDDDDVYIVSTGMVFKF